MGNFFLALIIGTLNDSFLIFAKVVFILYFVITSIIKKRTLYIDSIIRIYFIIFICGFFASVLFVMKSNISSSLYDIFIEFLSVNSNFSSGLPTIVRQNRQYLIEIVFSICLYYHLSNKNLKSIYSIIYISVLLNFSAILFDLLIQKKLLRLSMLFPEPSSAGYFYCFVFFLLSLSYFKSNYKIKLISYSFKILGILIFSKGQIIALFLYSVLRIKIKKMLVILLILLMFVSNYNRIYNYLPNDFTQTITEVQTVTYYLFKDGITGLSTKNGVSETYITRLASSFFAYKSMSQFPLGIGFGTYDIMLSNKLQNDKQASYIVSSEMDDISRGSSYGSPKSNLIEVIISSGIIAFISLCYIFAIFFKHRKNNKEIYNAIILFLLASLFLELNSFFVMMTFLIVILKKQLNINKKFSLKS